MNTVSAQIEDVESAPNKEPGPASNGIPSAWNIIDKNEEAAMSRRWKKPSETMTLVNHFISEGMTPKEVLAHMLPQYAIPSTMTDEFAVQVIFEMFSDRRTRDKLPDYNTFEQAVELFRTKRNILVLTGAGVSVSCGIPDFRSANGIYARLHKDFPELPDPQAMFDIDFFRKNAAPFFNFAKEIFPGQFKPSVSHMFIKFLEESGRLLRNYTQNIDTLEQIAGITRVIDCHGSFARSTCLDCGREVNSDEIKADVFAQRVAYCTSCKSGVMKPNIVFFGEDLGAKFHEGMAEDHDKVDLLVVIGSSLKVQPVALIPFNVAPDVPQILINREQLTRYNADIKLLGNCDEIVLALCLAIGGEIRQKMLNELETRSEQFPEFLTEFRTAVHKNDTTTTVLPRVISVKEFKRSLISTNLGNSWSSASVEVGNNYTEAERLDDDDDNCKRPLVKRARLDTVRKETEETSTAPIAVSGEVKAAKENEAIPFSPGRSVNLVTTSSMTTLTLSSSLVSSSTSSSLSASEIHSTSTTTTIFANLATDSDPSNQTITSTTKNVSSVTTAVVDTESNDYETLWESNYVNVSSVLPFNTSLFIPSNLNVFKGAELYYDRDSEAFCRRPGPVVTRLLDDDDCGSPANRRDAYFTDSSDDKEDESSSSDSSSGTSECGFAFAKTNSVPVDMKYATVDTSERTSASDEFYACHSSDFTELADVWADRANSCPVDFSPCFPNVTLEDCEAILNASEALPIEGVHL